MAKFQLEVPKNLLDDIATLQNECEVIFKEMTKVGAEVVYKNILANMPKSLATSEIRECLKITKPYIANVDGSVNTKIAFYGYFYNHKNELVPAPLVANVWEYGRSGLPFPKHPFMRKSFKAGQIEKAMLDKQKELTGGLLQ